MLNKLREQCESLKENDVRKYSLIESILKDDMCFFKMSIETSYSILTDLGYNKEELKKVYLKLINEDEYER